ncbi:hypothetical protein [Labilithrix luteola]|uniref:hypothetical protein n=1 Tax=Labilithrix luteola TaxID=1391654 RepID=UPI0011BA6C71|nr:hypothetical protein [Labilithrix luteola]
MATRMTTLLDDDAPYVRFTRAPHALPSSSRGTLGRSTRPGALSSVMLRVAVTAAIWVGLALFTAALTCPMTLAAHLALLFVGGHLAAIGTAWTLSMNDSPF